MPCGCGKKTGTVKLMTYQNKDAPNPEEWGTIVWRYLHCLTEKIGSTSNIILNTDQANHMEHILANLHLIIPCPECQVHATIYIKNNPLPSFKGLIGEQLRGTIRNWLFTFHNNTRIRKGQPIEINTVEEYIKKYEHCVIQECEYASFIQSVAYAVRLGWVKIDNWRKWYNNSERLRLITGNVIV